MTYEKIKSIVLSKTKGSFSGIVWEKNLPVRKAFGNVTVTKRTSGVARFGVGYDNMMAVKTKRETGELPAENQGLTWGTWAMYPYFIEHKGNHYVRISLDKNNKMKSEYFINGILSTKEQAEMYCTKAAFPSGNAPDVLSINIENVLAIK